LEERLEFPAQIVIVATGLLDVEFSLRRHPVASRVVKVFYSAPAFLSHLASASVYLASKEPDQEANPCLVVNSMALLRS
jgi:hypothetical protein